jgi:polysaccharide deacetylase family sporulation protein PdaB
MIIDIRAWLRNRNVMCGIFGMFVLSAAYLQIAEVSSNTPIAISSTQTAKKAVALTFDHSWGNTFTPPILDTLKENNVKATFFIMGPWANKYPEVAQRIGAEGHEIASHGHKHENYGEKTREWVKNDLKTAHEEIKSVTGVECTLVRPPNGSYSRESLQAIEDMGYKTIIWNIDSLDWKNPGRDVIVERVVKRLKPGGIILLHASDTPKQTAEALPELIKRIKDEGYQIVTVGDLLENYAENGFNKH